MNYSSIHGQFRSCAKQAGCMPTYWSMSNISLDNDRTTELTAGSSETMS